MNLFVAISDVHISLKNLDVSIATLTQALNKARDLKVPLFIAGDLNDGKAIMRSEWVKALIDLFIEYSDVRIHVLIGNHDLDNKNSESNSLYFLRTISNVVLYDGPAFVKFGHTDWGIIPYQSNNTEFLGKLDTMALAEVKNLLIHQGILGSYMGDYVVDESSVSPDVFKQFKIVLSGHYHKAQKVEAPSDVDIYYFGSPFTVNFGEANESKFIYVVYECEHTGKISLSYIPTEVRRHKQIEWSKEKNESDLPTPVIEIEKDSLLKVVVKGTKEFVRSRGLEFFQSKFPEAASISIVPEISKQSENRISADIIHQPLKVIDTYLENCTTDFDKSYLKDFLMKRCEEVFQKYSQLSSKSFKIIGVEVENFLSFKEMKFDYKPLGLTLLEGYDEDLGVNTGAGKSTFLDAPVYGLFGETSKKLKSDEVINRLSGKNLATVVSLQGEDGIYKVIRYRRHHQYENDLYMLTPNGQELRGKDNRETQKLIEQTIGCSFEVFLKSTYFTQFGSIDRFLSASDTEKKKLISEITDLSIYDEMLELVKKSIANDEKQIETVKAEINKIQYGVDTMVTQLNDLERRSLRWASDIEALIKSAEFESSEFDKSKADELDTLEKKHNGWIQFNADRIQQVKLLLDQWEVTQDLLKKDNELKIHINNGSIAEEEFKISELQQIPVVDITEEKKKIQAKLDIVEQLEKKLMQIEATRFSKKKEAEKLQDKIASEQAKLAQGADSDCMYCHQAISSQHIDKHICLYQDELKPILIEIEELSANMTKIHASIKIKPDLKKQLTDLDETYKKQYELKYKIELHRRTIKQLQDQNESILRENTQARINPHAHQLDSISKEVSPYINQIESVKNKTNPHTALIASYKAQTNPHVDGVAQLKRQIQDKKDLIVDMSLINEVHDKSLKMGMWWKQAIHVYIKSYLMDSCLESINTISNEYLQTLFDGVLKFDINATTEKGSEIKEKINVSIINNGDECSYDSLSGGERCRICLAVNLALAEVISKSSGKAFNMIFLDEIFNGLDEAGKSQSMKLLKDLEKKYESIFVIDHAEGFKNLFSNSIMVRKKNKVSTIV